MVVIAKVVDVYNREIVGVCVKDSLGHKFYRIADVKGSKKSFKGIEKLEGLTELYYSKDLGIVDIAELQARMTDTDLERLGLKREITPEIVREIEDTIGIHYSVYKKIG